MNPAQINDTYINLGQICDKSFAITAEFGYDHISLQNPAQQTVSFFSAAYFKGWPCRDGSSKKYNIMVWGLEVFEYRNKKFHSTYSSVKLKFFPAHGSKSKSDLEIHFDYQEPPQAAHPIFHAHISRAIVGSFGSGEFKRLFEKLKVPIEYYQSSPEYAHPNLKIPTAYMNMASVLLSLGASMMPQANFTQMLDQTGKSKIFKLDAHSGVLGFFQNKTAHGRHWYLGN